MAGGVRWTDTANNPYVPVFKKSKESCHKGYKPTKQWEKPIADNFQAKKLVFTFDGPRPFDTVQAGVPNAKPTGLPLP